MDTSTTRTVTDLPASDRQALEHLLGRPLSEGQQVFILAFTPESAVDETKRASARERLLQIFAKSEAYATKHNLTSDEADAAVAEAMLNVRGRN